jgi:hypothetical protein
MIVSGWPRHRPVLSGYWRPDALKKLLTMTTAREIMTDAAECARSDETLADAAR